MKTALEMALETRRGSARPEIFVQYDRDLPESWERWLWQIAPPSEHLTWLKLRWEPGDAWEPIHRWMIWQMRHPRMVRPDVLAELRGPSPRSAGHYCAPGWCACAIKRNAWRDGAARLIDYAQWKLFQETGHYGTRWWCVQGEHGGHRHRLSPVESKISKLNGGPPDTPAPGDLPYADFDLRVWRKIAQLDKVRMWKGVASYVERNHDTMDAEEEAEATQARWALWQWLESQVKHTVDSIGRGGVVALKEAQRNETMTKDEGRVDLEAIQQDFIHGA